MNESELAAVSLSLKPNREAKHVLPALAWVVAATAENESGSFLSQTEQDHAL